MKGLLTYARFSLGGSAVLVLAACLALGMVAVMVGSEDLEILFIFAVMGMLPCIALIKSDGNSNWERYQCAMPLRRRDIAAAPYLSVLLAAALGLPIAGAVWGASFLMNQGFAEHFWVDRVPGLALTFCIMMITAAIVLPLSCTKLGRWSGTGLFFVSLLASIGIVTAISVWTARLGLTGWEASLLFLVLGAGAYMVSLFISWRLYTRMDF